MKTILLVDDDESLREMFGTLLRRNGYYVIEAECGVGGFERARENLPDLILTDICMPGGHGEAFLCAIRDDPELRFTPVVVTSGLPDMLVPHTGTEEGADDFLMKALSIKGLLNCLQSRLAHDAVYCRADAQMAA